MRTEQGLSRIRGVLRRRKGTVAVTSVTTLLVAAAVIARLPPAYRAQAVLRVLESQPSKEYVSPTVTEQLGERWKTLRLSLMSRPLLAEACGALRLDDAFHKGCDAVVDDLRQRLEVKVEGEDTFLVSYEDADAARARAVVNHLTERFVDEQVRRRDRVALATEAALSSEVGRLRPLLDGLEEQVRAYKQAHYGALPEQQEENLRTLDQTTAEIDIQSTNLGTDQERRRQLVLSTLSPMRHQEDLLATDLHAALTRYTPEHPEVLRIEAELSRVHELRRSDEEKLRGSAYENPEMVALEGEIGRTRTSLGGLRRRQAELRARLGETASNGQKLSQLATALDAVRLKYQAALGKQSEAALSVGVERELRALRYDTVEAAVQPAQALRPNRPLLGFAGGLAALLLGLGAGFLRDFADTSIHSPEELRAVGPRPLEVLACVPAIDGASDEKMGRDGRARGGRRGDGEEGRT